MPQNERYVIGVDLGATKIYAILVDTSGKIIASARTKTKPELGFSAVVDRIVRCIRDAAHHGGIDLDLDVAAIGVGSPGPLDLTEGTIIETPNLKWQDAPLRARLEKRLHKRIVIDNDCNVGILGEYAYGAGHGAQHMVGLFIGTGIGGGVIIDGKLLHGYNQNAGELGHVILDPSGPACGCGVNGHLEAFASRLAIEREIRTSEASSLEADKKTGRIRSKKIAEAYFAGNVGVTAAIEKSATYVGYAVANFLNIFNPQVVVIGGGVVEAIGEPYVKIVRDTASKNVFAIARRNVRIVKAELGDDSAALGAAVLAWDSTKNEKL